MTLNVSFYLASRIWSRGQKQFSGFIIRMAVSATAISVAVMIVAASFMNGFQEVVQQKMFGFWGHIRIQQSIETNKGLTEEDPFSENDSVIRQIKTIPGIVSVERYATKSAILKYKTTIESNLLKGVDRHFDFKRLQPFLKEGRWPSFSDSAYGREVVISSKNAERLEAKIGDSLLVFFFREDGSRSARKLKIAGLFKTGIEEYDKHFTICDIRLIQRMNNWPANKIGAYEVYIDDPQQMNTLTAEIHQLIPPLWNAHSIRETYPSIFDWLLLQDQIKLLLIIILTFIAAVNLITSILILILERTVMTGILKALGAPNFTIQKIFIFHTGLIAATGILIGTALGLLICWLQIHTGFIQLDEDAYFISKAAVRIMPGQIAFINLITWCVCTATLLLPSLIIRKINPTKAIRFK